MIFAHTWQKVLDGSKTQTRRIVEDRHSFDIDKMAILSNGRVLYQVGKKYTVQAKRGGEALGRIEITHLHKSCLANMTIFDLYAEGFTTFHDFHETWVSLHGKLDYDQPIWVIQFRRVS